MPRLPQRRCRNRFRSRLLQVEFLERRQLLAVITDVVQQFREDDFTFGSQFQYSLNGSDYKDSIPSGSFDSTAGHAIWTSPTLGTAVYEGVATGSGSDKVLFGGSFHDCSRYAIRDQGGLDLSFDAGAKTVLVTGHSTISTAYTSYQDLTGGFCPASSPSSIFFGGLSNRYAGSFDPVTHRAAVSYTENRSGYLVNVSTTPAVVDWSNSTARDLSVVAQPLAPDIVDIPDGWTAWDLPQFGTPAALEPTHGRLRVSVAVAGEPFFAPASGAETPIGSLRLFWAASSGGPSLGEVAMDSGANTPNLYWNSASLVAELREFSTPPAGANFLAVEYLVPGITESSLANNVAYVPLANFQVRDAHSGPIDADSIYSSAEAGLLHPADAAAGQIRVSAYNPLTSLGASVTIVNEQGGFEYDPFPSAILSQLAQDEMTVDTIQFQAVHLDGYVDLATHTIEVRGINDAPNIVSDEVTERSAGIVSIISNLLNNDSDPDHGDRLQITTVNSQSVLGADLILTGGNTVRYDPTQTAAFLQLGPGESLMDSFSYQASDRLGASGSAEVSMTIVGQDDPPVLNSIADYFRLADQPNDPLPFTVMDWENPDPTTVSVVTSVVRSTFAGAVAVSVDGTEADRAFLVSVPGDESGRVLIQATAQDSGSQTSNYWFYYVVGSGTDADLDGISDAQEDSVNESGDGNGDGQRDAHQVNVASLISPTAANRTSIVAAAANALEHVANSTAGAPSGIANGALLPVGLISYRLVTPIVGQTMELEFLVDSSVDVNSFFEYIAPAEGGESDPWNWLMWAEQGTGAKVYDHRVVLTAVDGGRGDQDGVANGEIVGNVALTFVDYPWNNPVDTLDVDNNGLVAPLDAIQLINHLNKFGSHDLPKTLVGNEVISVYLDTHRDNILAPLDAIQVINYLNHRPAGGGEGETGISSPIANGSRAVSGGEMFVVLPARSGLDKQLGNPTVNPAKEAGLPQGDAQRNPYRLVTESPSASEGRDPGLRITQVDESWDSLLNDLAIEVTRQRTRRAR